MTDDMRLTRARSYTIRLVCTLYILYYLFIYYIIYIILLFNITRIRIHNRAKTIHAYLLMNIQSLRVCARNGKTIKGK